MSARAAREEEGGETSPLTTSAPRAPHVPQQKQKQDRQKRKPERHIILHFLFLLQPKTKTQPTPKTSNNNPVFISQASTGFIQNQQHEVEATSESS